ncbi:MAG TPA: peptidoglycan-binding domain-containing protein [Bryobacteraceae bacterium]
MFAGSLALSQSTATTSAPKKSATSTSVAKKGTSSSAKKTGALKKAVSSKTASSKKGKTAKKPVVAAYRQTAPTPDRYKEIQQALVDKGYLKSDANGVWDNDSVEALRQFQTDQKLTPTGKLSSASLIALGLGPKTDGASLNQLPPDQSAPSPIEPPPSITTAPLPEN